MSVREELSRGSVPAQTTEVPLEEFQDGGNRWGISTLQDVRFALRTLRKAWGFTATAVLTLALGIGANSAIFQLLDAVRLRTLPVANPRQLATVEIKGGNRTFGLSVSEAMLTYPQWEEIRIHQQMFSDAFAWASFGNLSLGDASHRWRVRELWVTGRMFSTLGVPAFRGRVFSAEEDRADCGAAGMVISYAFWQNEFGGQDSAIGSKLLIQDRLVEVIGVTPPNFFGLEIGRQFDVALPFCALRTYFPGNSKLFSKRDYFWVRVMGRIKPGLTLEEVSSQIGSMSPGIVEATSPSGYSAPALAEYRKFRLTAYPGGTGVSWLRQMYDAPLTFLLGITALVLLIACANLANLTLVRATSREREMAVRLALGASRWRLIRELLSESLLIAAGGGLLGIALAVFFSKSLVKFLSTQSDVIRLDLSVDWRVLAFTSTTAILTCVIFGLVPALRSSRTEPGVTLKTGSRGTTAGRERFSFQRLLIVSQIAVSLVLLVGALLFVRSFWNLMAIDPGFREKDIVVASLGLQKLKLSVDSSPAFVRNLVTQVKSVRQVDSAATSTHLPLDPDLFWNLGVRINGSEGPCRFTWVSPSYFETMEIPLLAGRDFNQHDTETSARVAIVNETFVRKYLEDSNPLGKLIRTNAEPNYPETAYQIVGIVRDTKYQALREPTPPIAFVPADQFPARAQDTFLFIFMRSSSPPAALMSAVREKLSQVNPEMTVDFHIFKTDIENGLLRERLMAVLSGFFGALAALLASVGLYGVISYIITMRKNEIGIRMALGASRQTIIRVILRQTVYLLALGISLGVVLSLVATRSAESLLFGLHPNDPITLIGAAGFLVTVALLASYVPARRASRLDPMLALRYE